MIKSVNSLKILVMGLPGAGKQHSQKNYLKSCLQSG